MLSIGVKELLEAGVHFGSLPPDDSARDETPPHTADEWPTREYDTGPEHNRFYGSDHDQTSFRKSQQPRRRGYSGIIVIGIITAIGFMTLGPLFTDIHNAPETAVSEYPGSGLAADNFTANQADSSVSPKASATGNTADVHADWQVNEKDTEYSAKPSPISGRAVLISIGASKQDVLAIQGRPLRKTDTEWDYGLSRINFEDGKVTSWGPRAPHLILMLHGTGMKYGWPFWNYPIHTGQFRKHDFVVAPESENPDRGFVQGKADRDEVSGLSSASGRPGRTSATSTSTAIDRARSSATTSRARSPL